MSSVACSVGGCPSQVDTKGMCRAHYLKSRAEDAPECSLPGCAGRAFYADGLCQSHYLRRRKGTNDWDSPIRVKGGQKPCTVSGCPALARSKGMCQDHYYKSRKYGVSPDDLYKLETESCGICAAPPVKTGKRHVIDHDHQCCSSDLRAYCGNCIRGVLCNRCNLGLGQFKDNPEFLRGAIRYLFRNGIE